MIEHWYDYFPAAWMTPGGRWFLVLYSIVLLALGIAIGVSLKRKNKQTMN